MPQLNCAKKWHSEALQGITGSVDVKKRMYEPWGVGTSCASPCSWTLDLEDERECAGIVELA